MPTSAERPDVLVDTSVAVAVSVEDHELHRATVHELDGQVLGLAGHVTEPPPDDMTR